MAELDCARLDWTLEGWRPFAWRLGRGVAAAPHIVPDIGPIAAYVPGSVQESLRRAGLLPDWNIGVNARLCEWVEHRHWLFEATVPAGMISPGEHVWLCADGLDYAGWILVDDREVAAFSGALVPHQFDLSASLGDGEAHRLALVFEEPPREQGQIGYTSRSRFFKPRYVYSWDWCPRLVPVGPWDTLCIKAGAPAAFHLARLAADLSEDLRWGRIELEVDCAAHAGPGCNLLVVLRDGDLECARETAQVVPGMSSRLVLEDIAVAPWWPNGMGEQRLYSVEVSAVDAPGDVLWRAERSVGFRRIAWQACEGAPADAEPWICVVNGKPVFLQGANWVPPRLSYHDATEADYRTLIALYREMGCNVLRVWGGGILERECFYDLCDQAGILVWQEFPLSSSGVENDPPRDPAAIDDLLRVARTYITRRAHHASLLLWSGGNELTLDDAVPAGYDHPCIAALKSLVAAEDPGRRFIPTSPSGPMFCARAENYGKGIHHDIHGPWGMSDFADLEAWRCYWAGDDALFRSEVGMPAAMDAERIRAYAGGMPCWPAEGAYWRHTAAWWTQMDRFGSCETLDAYVRDTQAFQAEAYAIAAAACKGRFPRCGGFIIWMGHDCFPCPANNSAIDFDRAVKPAYAALRQIFRREAD